jgi:GNAT superfamily N-acetyltransferase
LAYHILPLFHSTEKYLRIVSLVIDQLYRGAGIGKALLQEAEKIAVMEGCTSIELTTGKHRIKTGTHAFYQAHGYASELDSVYFRKKIVL